MVPRSSRKVLSNKTNPDSSEDDLDTTKDSSRENNPRNIKVFFFVKLYYFLCKTLFSFALFLINCFFPFFQVDKESLSSFNQQLEALSRYAEIKSSPEPELLYNLRQETEVAFGEASRMLSGHLQGRLLSLLAGSKQPSCQVLELGTFTGYMTSCTRFII